RFRQMDLTPMATAILAEMLIAAQPLATAVQRACAAEQRPVTPKLLEAIGRVIEDLAERGAILGGRLEAAPPPDPSPFFRWLYDADAAAGRPGPEEPVAPS